MDVDVDNAGIGYAPLIREYVFFLESKLNFHRNHPEFNGTPTLRNWTWGRSLGQLTDAGLFEYEEYISLKTINDPNEGYVLSLVAGLEGLLTEV
jgi:hypothetical protein